jgi:myo-inositol-1(or 4)-monophosphatase
MPGINDQELDEVYQFAIQLGKDAGDMLMNAARSRMQGKSSDSGGQVAYVEKENSVDLVTKTDNGTAHGPIDEGDESLGGVLTCELKLEVGEFIRTSILNKYPSHRHVSPEITQRGSGSPADQDHFE